MAEISGEPECEDSAIEAFDEVMVRQLISNIKVLGKDRILVRFKDGTEIKQVVENQKRAST